MRCAACSTACPARPGADPRGRFTLNVISKSGETLETALAFRLLRRRAEQVWGADARRAIVATTDAARGRLRDLATAAGYESFEVPDNVGGRYSVLTAVGLLPAAVVGIDVAELLAGARYMAGLCAASDPYLNPAYLLAVLHTLMYRQKGRTISVFATWSPRLEAVGLWYDQLLAESLGKDGIGPTPLTVVNSRELHSRGQQHQEGAHDKLITNVVVTEPSQEHVVLPEVPGDADGLNYLAGRTLHAGQQAAIEATAFAYRRAGRPDARHYATHRATVHGGPVDLSAGTDDRSRGLAARGQSARPTGCGSLQELHVRPTGTPGRAAVRSLPRRAHRRRSTAGRVPLVILLVLTLRPPLYIMWRGGVCRRWEGVRPSRRAILAATSAGGRCVLSIVSGSLSSGGSLDL